MFFQGYVTIWRNNATSRKNSDYRSRQKPGVRGKSTKAPDSFTPKPKAWQTAILDIEGTAVGSLSLKNSQRRLPNPLKPHWYPESRFTPASAPSHKSLYPCPRASNFDGENLLSDAAIPHDDCKSRRLQKPPKRDQSETECLDRRRKKYQLPWHNGSASGSGTRSLSSMGMRFPMTFKLGGGGKRLVCLLLGPKRRFVGTKIHNDSNLKERANGGNNRIITPVEYSASPAPL